MSFFRILILFCWFFATLFFRSFLIFLLLVFDWLRFSTHWYGRFNGFLNFWVFLLFFRRCWTVCSRFWSCRFSFEIRRLYFIDFSSFSIVLLHEFFRLGSLIFGPLSWFLYRLIFECFFRILGYFTWFTLVIGLGLLRFGGRFTTTLASFGFFFCGDWFCTISSFSSCNHCF